MQTKKKEWKVKRTWRRLENGVANRIVKKECKFSREGSQVSLIVSSSSFFSQFKKKMASCEQKKLVRIFGWKWTLASSCHPETKRMLLRVRERIFIKKVKKKEKEREEEVKKDMRNRWEKKEEESNKYGEGRRDKDF